MEDVDIDYTIAIRKQADIVSELTDDPTERLIFESIIDGIECTAAETINANKIAQLPSIGCIRKDPVKQAIRNNYSNFKLAKQNLSTEQYKDYSREIVLDVKIKQEREDKYKAFVRSVRSRNKKKYDKIYTTLGRAYAEMFIYSMLCFSEVPYDAEVQYAYDRLNNLL